MKSNKISLLSKVILLIVAGLFIGSLQFPMWKIELDAPQYPEGLELLLYADKIGGDVEIINGLNHYIGMKTLHTEDFIEFKILPYIIYGFAGLTLLMLLWGRQRGVVIVFLAVVIFALVAGLDFYRWNYEYGHNLDPNAAIKVPGMAYQPPVLGYKQLLNFGAYSIPNTGGWMLISAAVLLLVSITYDTQWYKRFLKKNTTTLALMGFVLLGCGPDGPQPIKLHIDQCEYCKMSVSDGKFGAELITKKGRVYMFDDIQCMAYYGHENPDKEVKLHYIHDYTRENQLIPAETAFYLIGGEINSPMRGNIAAFSSAQDRDEFAIKLNANPITWEEILRNHK